MNATGAGDVEGFGEGEGKRNKEVLLEILVVLGSFESKTPA